LHLGARIGNHQVIGAVAVASIRERKMTMHVMGKQGEKIRKGERWMVVSVENYVTTDHQIRSLPSHQQ
jgi:hypothetical protein